MEMTDAATEQQVRATLHKYCTAFDEADFKAFAALFEKGRWFMVSRSGSEAVFEWIAEHVLLYDGRPLTRHEITNVLVAAGEHPDEASFSCYVAIWQHLPDTTPQLLTHARFSGTFRQSGTGWWWDQHVMTADYAGDLGHHIKGGLSALDS